MSHVDASRGAALDIGPWRPGDEASIGRLFERVFGRAQTVAHWRWQFLAPDGVPRVTVARDERGEVVAHFGCVPRRAVVDGVACMVSNGVDSMVAPEHRAGLTRRSLFVRLGELYVESFGWPGPDHFGYGLPSPAALRIGSRQLGYVPLREAELLVRPVAPSPRCVPGLDVQIGPEAPRDHDELWARVAAQRTLTVVRDRRYMAWRYERRPGGAYQFVLARRGGALAALAVFTPRAPSEHGATVADLLWPGDDEEALRACLDETAALAQREGRQHLALLAAPDAPEARPLPAQGWRPVPLGLPLIARCFAPNLDPEVLRNRWSYALGDFDLI